MRLAFAFVVSTRLQQLHLFVNAINSGEVIGPTWVPNPIARHVACPIEANVATACPLYTYEATNQDVDVFITTLPLAGQLFETSPNYRALNSDPKHAPDPIGEHMLPYRINDPLNRVVYLPPYNVWPPEGFWASISYVCRIRPIVDHTSLPLAGSTNVSEAGFAVFANPEGSVAGSTFDLADDYSGWSVSGNYGVGGLNHQAFVWGGLNRYVYGADEITHTDFATGFDRSKWYFEASPAFRGQELAATYGGKIRFTIRALYGNFTMLNDPLDWITIECESCNTGRGMRIVRFVDEIFFWQGEEKKVEVELSPLAKWKKDPLNSALTFEYATACQIAAVLSNVSRVAILADFARGGEAVAIDDVAIVAAPPALHPIFPHECQAGCNCVHDPGTQHPRCC